MPATSRPKETAPAAEDIVASARLPKAALFISPGIARELLRQFVERLSCLELAGEAGDHASALDEFRRIQPGVVVMDWCMASSSQPHLASILRRESPAVRILVVHAVSA